MATGKEKKRDNKDKSKRDDCLWRDDEHGYGDRLLDGCTLSSRSTSSSPTDEEKCEGPQRAKPLPESVHGDRLNCLVTHCPRAPEGGVERFRFLCAFHISSLFI